MKKYISIFLTLIISLMSLSFNHSENKNDTDGSESMQEEIFTSPDLSLFQLKAHVKKCIITDDGLNDEIYEFDQQGNLISPKYEKIERDENGAIIEYYDPDTETTTRIKWENGNVIAETELFDDGYNASVVGFEYDDEGNIVQFAQSDIAFPFNCSNYEFDEFGNWISRDVEANGSTYKENRYITYYGSEVGQKRLLDHYAQKKERMIKRNL